MSSILTPVTLWEDFEFDSDFSYEVISDTTNDDIRVKELFIKGRKIGSDTVKIYAVSAEPDNNLPKSAVFVLFSYKSPIDKQTLIEIAKQGYLAFSVDFMGDAPGKGEHYTVYPKSISYANADTDTDSIHCILDSVQKSCWYEWGAVARYGFRYLKNSLKTKKISGLGVYQGSLLLWHLAALEQLTSAVFISGAGWRAYRGSFKFDDVREPDFDESVYNYLAGVEPQAYAQYVKCPVLLLTATNNPYCDNDRAYDTISRIDKSHYTAIDYSINETIGIHEEQLKAIRLFWEKTIIGKKIKLPSPVDIETFNDKRTIKIKVKADSKELSKITIYYAEDTINPAYRCWRPLTSPNKTNGEYVAEYTPNAGSKIVFFFARAEYENGFAVSSNVTAEKLEPGEVTAESKLKVIFSAKDDPVIFNDGKRENEAGRKIVVKKSFKRSIGPMGIYGVSTVDRIATFAINSEKDKPIPNGNLMLDVYSPLSGKLSVKLIAVNGKEITEYVYMVNLNGYKVWEHVKASIEKFKTAEGKGISSLENINRIVFEKDGEFAVNNILWI